MRDGGADHAITSSHSHPGPVFIKWATTGSGTSSTLLGRGTFDEFKVKRETDTLEVQVKAKSSLDIATQMITFHPLFPPGHMPLPLWFHG